MEDNKGNEREELYSQRVRAGKRTYFFDVRTTRGGDYYVTITESKKVFNDDGFYYQKHKIYLYKPSCLRVRFIIARKYKD